jgi:hypothetical protein
MEIEEAKIRLQEGEGERYIVKDRDITVLVRSPAKGETGARKSLTQEEEEDDDER